MIISYIFYFVLYRWLKHFHLHSVSKSFACFYTCHLCGLSFRMSDRLGLYNSYCQLYNCFTIFLTMASLFGCGYLQCTHPKGTAELLCFAEDDLHCFVKQSAGMISPSFIDTIKLRRRLFVLNFAPWSSCMLMV